MQRSLARYEQLIAEELAGIITPEDQAALDKAKAEIPAVNELWKAKNAVFAEKAVQEWADREMKPPAVSNWPVMKRYKRLLFVAASLLPLIVAFLIKGPPPETVCLSASSIELRLDNGTVFDLSYKRKEKKDMISLNAQDTFLTYTSSSNQQATLSVPEGKHYTITLSDGSRVYMNSSSSINFPLSFDDSSRKVSLSGEAYFEVAHDAKRPFTVSASNAKVSVLGTAFNVNSYDKEHPVVALVTGGVRFDAGKQSQVLKPGQAGFYTGKGIDTTNFSSRDLLGWRKGLFTFHDISLEDLCRMIPRWFGRKIVIDQAATGKRHCTGDFDRYLTLEKNLEQFKAQGVDYEVRGDVVHLVERK